MDSYLKEHGLKWENCVGFCFDGAQTMAGSRRGLEEECIYEAASKFRDEQFLLKLAYLSDVFGKLNELNLQLQVKDKHLPHLADKITAFSQKLEVWDRRLDQQNIDVFENLSEVAETTDSGATTVIPCIKQHISSLRGLFQKYFPINSAQYDWVMDPFNAVCVCVCVCVCVYVSGVGNHLSR